MNSFFFALTYLWAAYQMDPLERSKSIEPGSEAQVIRTILMNEQTTLDGRQRLRSSSCNVIAVYRWTYGEGAGWAYEWGTGCYTYELSFYAAKGGAPFAKVSRVLSEDRELAMSRILAACMDPSEEERQADFELVFWQDGIAVPTTDLLGLGGDIIPLEKN